MVSSAKTTKLFNESIEHLGGFQVRKALGQYPGWTISRVDWKGKNLVLRRNGRVRTVQFWQPDYPWEEVVDKKWIALNEAARRHGMSPCKQSHCQFC